MSLIQPDLCHGDVLCSGCDAETDTAIWFQPTDSDRPAILCTRCCSTISFAAAMCCIEAARNPNKRSVFSLMPQNLTNVRSPIL